MELFPDGAFVRLRSLARDKYVHADEDASGVSLRPLGAAPSVNAVWRAERWPVVADAFLLQGAAYGRYLAVSPREAPPGHRGVRAVQRDFNAPSLDDACMWTADMVDATRNHVRLRSSNQRCLRANGRYRYWNNVVTVDVGNGSWTSTMMQWRVEAIPLSPYPLRLPPPPPPPPIHVSRGLFKLRIGPGMRRHPGRRIRYMRLDDDGNFVYDHWPEFDFYDNDVANLRNEVALRLGCKNITLCVRSGMYALVIPLLTNLPRNEDPMDIMVLTTGSPAFGMLEYPQFDIPEP